MFLFADKRSKNNDAAALNIGHFDHNFSCALEVSDGELGVGGAAAARARVLVIHGGLFYRVRSRLPHA